MKNIIRKFYYILYSVLMALCKIFLIADIAITSMAVAGRFISFIPDPAWSEEIVLTCMIYMALISAALATNKGTHIRMTALDKYLPTMAIKILDVFSDLVVLVFALIMAIAGAKYAANVGKNSMYTSIRWLSKFWLYIPVAIAGVSIALFQIEIFWRHIRILIGKENEK